MSPSTTAKPATKVPKAFLPRIQGGPKGETLPYRLVLPLEYEARKSYPLFLFLHGSGERGDDNAAQLHNVATLFGRKKFQAKFPSFVVVPQCPEGQHWGGHIRGWAEKSDGPSAPIKMALTIIEDLTREFSIDPKRLYIAGLSMGGYGVWDVIARDPKRFAAAIVCCGAGDPKTISKAAARVPLWAFHSDDDGAVPGADGRAMVEAMRKKGGHSHYTEYHGIGHNCWDRAFAEPKLLPWLFAQRQAWSPTRRIAAGSR